METSPEINLISLALSIAQGEFGHAEKDATNPHFKSTYATITAVKEATRASLAKNKLALLQFPENSGDHINLVTMLVHESGQYFKSQLAVRPAKPDAQGVGSCLTYMRRYTEKAILGIADDDDDGEAAMGRDKPANQQRNQNQGVPAAPPRESKLAVGKFTFGNPAHKKSIDSHLVAAGLMDHPDLHELGQCEGKTMDEAKVIVFAFIASKSGANTPQSVSS